MENSVEIDGNVFILREGVVWKKHLSGEKPVSNPDRIAQVKSSLETPAKPDNAASKKVLKLSPVKKSKKTKK